MHGLGKPYAMNFEAEQGAWAAERRAVFAQIPTGPNQVWQTSSGGTWRIAGCADYHCQI